jgi:hypothetical protein
LGKKKVFQEVEKKEESGGKQKSLFIYLQKHRKTKVPG